MARDLVLGGRARAGARDEEVVQRGIAAERHVRREPSAAFHFSNSAIVTW